MAQLNFTINHKQFIVDCNKFPVQTTLNTFIRENAGLTGTKFMCLEGGCGACICVIINRHPINKKRQIKAINSCLTLLNSCDGAEIITIEGIGNRKDGYHPIQTRLAHLNGSQCGYCSPGFVMNMSALLAANTIQNKNENENKNERKLNLTMNEIEDSFGGNLCRCTGYRPILDAMKSFATNSEYDLCDDIEDLLLINRCCNKKNLQKCSEHEKCHQNNQITKNCNNLLQHYIDNNGFEWYTPKTLNELIQILLKLNVNLKYILIGGNTGYGVYRTSFDITIYIDINQIQELHNYEFNGQQLKLGGNLNLTETMNIFQNLSTKPGFEYCQQLYEHFKLIAHIPVRNVGTLAGNLMLKHQHNEFQSDIFLLFETLQVQITILDATSTDEHIMGLLEFLRTDMYRKIIKLFTFKAYPKDQFLFDSYKITPRAQNAHAIVNGAFLINYTTKPNDRTNLIVKNAQICYGGIRPDFTHAIQTEKSLQGKLIFDNNVITTTFHILNEEIQPDWILPDLSPAFRQLLACSLYYKFLLSHAPSNRITNATFKSGGYPFVRGLSSGIQTFELLTKDYPLRQPVTKLEAQIQTAGEAFYMNDLPHYPNELWAAFVHATNVGYKIVEIDPHLALQLPGVVAFYSAQDIPGVNSFVRKNELFNFVADEEIFCSSIVKYYDQPLGIIVATSTKLAEKAALLVKVLYERPEHLPELCVRTEDVLEKKQFHRIFAHAHADAHAHAHAHANQKLVGEKLSSESSKSQDFKILKEIPKEIPDESPKEIPDEIPTAIPDEIPPQENSKYLQQTFKGYLKLDTQYHFTMEPQTTICIPSDFGIDVNSSTQWMDLTQDVIARALKLTQFQIQLQVPRLGGAYGSKISRGNQIACACALACLKLNKPIRFIQSIESMMRSLGKRFALYCDYNGNTEWNGKIINLNITFYSEAGSTLNESPVDILLLPTWKNCYDSSNNNWIINPYSVITDTPSHTWMRAPGTVEAIAMIETIMEHIAYKTKRDSIYVRLENISSTNKMKQLLTDFIINIDYNKRFKDIQKFNQLNRWRKRGLGICVMQFPIEYVSNFAATVVIYQDGSVAISHGGIEMGQGINTKAIQVAAYILQIPLNYVKVLPSNTFNGANSFISGASVASECVCYAVKKACEILNQRLLPIKAKLHANATWIEITKTAFNSNVNLIANSIEIAGDIQKYVIYGIACSDVEIDILTGNIILRRVDILEDTGESLSPWIDIGQVEGAFITGLGYWLTENLIFNRITGELLTDRTWNYKIPGAKDIPVDFRINLLQKSPNPNGFLKSKASGEPALCLSISAVFGIRHALDSALADAGKKPEWYHLGAPTTIETILLNSGTSVDQFHL